MKMALPTFRTTSEIIGGLLGAYSLTGDGELLQKAAHLGHLILDSFVDNLPMPVVLINATSRASRSTRVPLVDIGGLSLDLCYLGDLLGEKRFRERMSTLSEYIRTALFANSGVFAEEIELQLEAFQPHGVYSLGHRAGPTYEYMIKDSLYIAGRDARAQKTAYALAQVSLPRN
jgi:mannosyl-oligosaccharide alpha-1,2-mannosidase